VRIEVRHVTKFRFAEKCAQSTHLCRLTPRPGEGQRVVAWSVRTPGKPRDWTDGYGNLVRMFTLVEPHQEIEIVARGVYEWMRASPGPLVHTDPEPLPPIYWLRNHGLARHEETVARFVEDLKAQAAVEEARVEVLEALMLRIGAHLEYRPGATAVDAPASAALAAGAGVSQDYAHLFIASCRALGIPARYVSGYLRAQGELHGGKVGHAWAEAHVPALGWIAFDPSNRQRPTAEYLKLAVGLDYAEAAPVTGRRLGGGEATMDVETVVKAIG